MSVEEIKIKINLNERIKFIVDNDGKFIIVTQKGWMKIMSSPNSTVVCNVLAIYQNALIILDSTKTNKEEGYAILFDDIKEIID